MAVFLVFLPLPALAQVPPTMVASLGKQILQNLVFGSLKSELFGSLADMGCKGATIAGIAAAASTGRAGVTRAMGSQARAGARGPMGGPGAGMGSGMDPAMMQKAMEMMQQQGRTMTPEQQAMVQNAMTQMQGAMSKPLARDETKAVFDDLADIGLINDKMRAEAKDCITYAPPGAGDQVGAAGALLQNTVIPAARDAKARMAATSPEEQKQLADGMVDALNSASPADRKAFFDGMGLGFFPAPVVDQVRARVKP
jgi:hypothetical protein